MYRHTGWPKKLAHFCTVQFVHLITSSDIDQFSNFLTARIRSKFVIVLSLNIVPKLKCVAALPCEMSMSLSNNFKKTSETHNLRT